MTWKAREPDTHYVSLAEMHLAESKLWRKTLLSRVFPNLLKADLDGDEIVLTGSQFSVNLTNWAAMQFARLLKFPFTDDPQAMLNRIRGAIHSFPYYMTWTIPLHDGQTGLAKSFTKNDPHRVHAKNAVWLMRCVQDAGDWQMIEASTSDRDAYVMMVSPSHPLSGGWLRGVMVWNTDVAYGARRPFGVKTIWYHPDTQALVIPPTAPLYDFECVRHEGSLGRVTTRLMNRVSSYLSATETLPANPRPASLRAGVFSAAVIDRAKALSVERGEDPDDLWSRVVSLSLIGKDIPFVGERVKWCWRVGRLLKEVIA